MRKACLGLALLVLSCAVFAANPVFGEFSQVNFLDDTLAISYRLGLSNSSALLGMSRTHPYGPSLAVPSSQASYSLFYKIVPDSGSDSIAVSACQFWIDEVDASALVDDTVYTVLADTGSDTLSTTGVVADTNWTKRVFTSNPCQGLRVTASGTGSCSSVMNSTLMLWFRLRKKLGMY